MEFFQGGGIHFLTENLFLLALRTESSIPQVINSGRSLTKSLYPKGLKYERTENQVLLPIERLIH